MQIAGLELWSDVDANNPTDVTVLRSSAQEVLYTVANSNAYRGRFAMRMPTWQIIMIIIDCFLVSCVSVWGFFVIKKSRKIDK